MLGSGRDRRTGALEYGVTVTVRATKAKTGCPS